MTPTNTITDGTSLPLLGGTPVFFNFTTKAAVDYFEQPKGVGDPTAQLGSATGGSGKIKFNE